MKIHKRLSTGPAPAFRALVAGLVAATLGGVASAKDDPRFGPAVDAFCTAEGRDPATPFADGKSATPKTECQLCHQPFTLDKAHTTQGFDEWKLATNTAKGTGNPPDFSWFCPDAAVPMENQPPTLEPIGDQLVDENGLLDLVIVASDPDGDAIAIEASDVPTGAVFQDNGFGTATFVWMPDFDSAGNYPVLFRATDTGSPPLSVSESIVITVGDVNRPPVLDPVGSQSVAAGGPLTLPLSASDPDLDPVRFGAAGVPPTATFVDLGNGTAEFSWLTGAGDVGNHSLTFTATDEGVPMQSDSETVVVTVGAVNRPPELAPIGAQEAHPLAPLPLVITATDPDGDTVSLAVDSLPDGATFLDAGDGSALFDWTPRVDQPGNYQVTCTATDRGIPPESDSETFTISVGSVNRPPVLDPIALMEEGPALVIALTARDPDGDRLAFSLVGMPDGATFTDHGDRTAEFRWEPAADLAGDFPLTFVVTDDGIPAESTSGSTTISLAAAPATPPPTTAAAPVKEQQSVWSCGIGFELVFVLLPLLRARRRRARRA